MEQDDLISSIESEPSAEPKPLPVDEETPFPRQPEEPKKKRSFFDILTLIAYIVLGIVGIAIVVLLLIG